MSHLRGVFPRVGSGPSLPPLVRNNVDYSTTRLLLHSDFFSSPAMSRRLRRWDLSASGAGPPPAAVRVPGGPVARWHGPKR